MKSIEELKENGCCAIDGRKYILTEQASFQCDSVDGLDDWEFNNYYSARAICADDEVDEDGYQKCYKIRWEIIENYDPEYMGEDCACDWDSPTSAEEVGAYNMETGCYY